MIVYCIYSFSVTVLIRDYTRIKKEDCRLFTEYGGKRYQRPCGIAIGPNEEVVIVDEVNQDAIIFDKNLTQMRVFGQGSGDGKLNKPLGVAMSHNLIAISEHKYHVVKVFSLQGNYLSKFGSPGTDDGQFKFPQGLCFSTKGLLYVVDRDNHRIQVFNERNEFAFKFGSKGSGPGQFTCASDIALSRRDQIFVTDWSPRSCVNIYHENGEFISKIECASKPLAIALTPDGCVITSNDEDHCLTIMDTCKRHTPQVFGGQGSKEGEFKYIQGIAVNSSGTIFVTDSGNDRLQVIYP